VGVGFDQITASSLDLLRTTIAPVRRIFFDFPGLLN